MKNKLVLVTGGTRGIGAAISKIFAENKYKVIASFVSNEENANKFANENNVIVKRFDASSFEQCQNAISEINAEYGNIEILVNNAGITRDGFLHKQTKNNWHDVISTNLTSVFNTCFSVIKQMRDNNFGRIINIASINAFTGQIGQTNYCAAKAGMIGFTKSLALENASKGITVNAIAPGYIETDMTAKIDASIMKHIIDTIPQKRLGTADEVAHSVYFLADEKAAYITGTTLHINGGKLMF